MGTMHAVGEIIMPLRTPPSLVRALGRHDIAAYCEACRKIYTEQEALRLPSAGSAPYPGGHHVYRWCVCGEIVGQEVEA